MGAGAAPARHGTVIACGLVWLAVASAVSAAGLVSKLQPPGPGVLILVLAGLVLAAGRLHAGFRAWLATIDVRWMVALHLSRFVGFYFLYLYGKGQLPFAFAVPAGWGDVSVAVTAALLLASGPPLTRPRRVLYGLWNLYGLADILFVMVTAARVGIANPQSMSALVAFPLALLPTFLVPLIVASHVVLGIRMAHGDPRIGT